MGGFFVPSAELVAIIEALRRPTARFTGVTPPILGLGQRLFQASPSLPHKDRPLLHWEHPKNT